MQQYAQSIENLVALQSLDWERLQELQSVKFVAGWNMAGYMPDSEPGEFETFDQAKRYIIDEMLQTAESTDESVSENLTHAAEEANLESRPFSYTVDGIAFWVAHAEKSEELKELEDIAGDCKDEDDARDAINEHPLSVEVRSDWTIQGRDFETAEFRIVIATGGPHVEIRGEMDHRGEPHRAWLQWRDWGTSFQRIDISQPTLLAYCANFFGY